MPANDGKVARVEPVTFTRPAAERIAKVVRKVEAGDRNAKPLVFGRVPVSAGPRVRICTFTGAWDIDAFKTVTLKYQTTTPNTVTAVNLFLNLPSDGTKNCAIAKDGTAWHLIQWEWVTVTCGTATASP